MIDVTVVLPIYNGLRRSPNYLPEAIESVLNQDYNSFELIIVDDGSDEDYSSLREKYEKDPRVRWYRKENEGQSAARNHGAELGIGKWLAFIDQDDRWYNNRLKETVDTMIYKRNLGINCVMVYSDLDRIDSLGHIICQNFIKENHLGIHPKKRLEDILGNNAFILPGTMLVEREEFLNLGGFNKSLSGYEDDELSLRFFYIGRLVFIKKALIQWRIYQESYSYSERMDRSRMAYWGILINAHGNDKKQNEMWVRDQIAPRFYYEWLHAWRKSLVNNDKSQASRARSGLAQVAKHLPMKLRIKAIIGSVLPYSVAFFLFKSELIKRFAHRFS